MSLHGCRQLIQWSLEHACMSDNERERIWREWESRWKLFTQWICIEYGNVQKAPDKKRKDDDDFYYAL